MLVVATGARTRFGGIAAALQSTEPPSAFERGIHRLGVLILRLTSFLVLFVAEWGDLSQLLTAGLVVKYEDPVSVGVGAMAALAAVSALGAVLGRTLLKRIKLATIRRVGGGVCLLLATMSLVQVANISLTL